MEKKPIDWPSVLEGFLTTPRLKKPITKTVAEQTQEYRDYIKKIAEKCKKIR
jgi:hypothetical protein